MSKGKDEAFEKAYASVVENGWTNVKHMARQVWDLARATPPAAQVQGEEPEVVAWLNTLTGDTTSHQVQVMDWDDEKEPVQALMTVAQYERIAAALELKLCTSDYAYDSSMYEVKRLVRELDVLLNGEEGAAEQASLCDLVGQVASVVRAKGSPLLSAPPAAGVPEDSRTAIPADVLRDIGTMLDDAMAAPYPNSMAVPDHLVNVAYWMTYGRSGYAPASPAVGVHFDDQRGEFRAWFEGWVLETEHPGLGWLGEHSLDQGDTPNSYADQYVHGAWVMAMHLSVEIKRAQFHSHLHLQRAKLAESAIPTPPASEQQQAVVMPERQIAGVQAQTVDTGSTNHIAGWNACLNELLRLNPHLAGVNQGVTTEAGNGGGE